MNALIRGLQGKSPPRIRNETSSAALFAGNVSDDYLTSTASAAMKLSSVDRCIEVLSDSMGKLPIYVMDRKTRIRVEGHPLNEILSIRPNEAQTPTVAKKMAEANRVCGGNGYLWIERDRMTLRPVSMLPVPHELVTQWWDTNGHRWYSVIHPFTGQPMTVHPADMVHTMAYTHNGYSGISVLARASEVIGAGRAAQQYNLNYYANGGQPAGVLTVDADLSGDVEITLADGRKETISHKEYVRREWEKYHRGSDNAHRVAILDYGLKYSPISVSNKDAQFVEQSELSVQDIARFFGVPLYKLQAGKQSYASNEQNAIEYVVSTLHPNVTQWEEAMTWTLLPASQAKQMKIRVNMMAELRGDVTSRSAWYKAMREIGAFSVNDILALEDMPDVEGGDERYASLNYVPLALFRQASMDRNLNQNGGEKT